jgi:glycosyltransferase involved in cell wall biosynthesis
MDRGAARALLGLAEDRTTVLFGADRGTTDPNKGWHLLQPALRLLAKRFPETQLVVFGSSAPPEMPDLGMPAVFLGRLGDEASLVAAYSAADAFVAPSLQEAFCQTAAESLACGTPVVAFRGTGLLDVVEHEREGYLAQPFEVEDLARGIAWVLEDRDRHEALAGQARRKALGTFGLAAVAQRYVELYREVVAVPASGPIR